MYLEGWCDNSESTLRLKARNLECFREWLEGLFGRPVKMSEIERQHARSFLERRLRCGDSGRTILSRLASLKHLYSEWSARAGVANVMRGMTGPHVQDYVRSWTGGQLSLFRTAINKDPNQTRRTKIRALFELQLQCGLRAGEMLRLTEGQLSPDRQMIRKVKRKNRHANIYIPPGARMALSQYLKDRLQELEKRDTSYALGSSKSRGRWPIFCSWHSAEEGQPDTYRMDDRTWRRQIKALCKEVGVEGSTHCLRHTHGKLVCDEYGLRETAESLGVTLQTALRYAMSTEEEKKKKANKLWAKTA